MIYPVEIITRKPGGEQAGGRDVWRLDLPIIYDWCGIYSNNEDKHNHCRSSNKRLLQWFHFLNHCRTYLLNMDGVSWRDTFSIIPFFGNCERCLLTPSTILKKLGLYWKCLLKRHFLQFSYTVEIFEFMLKRDIFSCKIISTIFNTYWILWNCGKVSFQETPLV